MGLYEAMKTSERLETQGIWLEVSDNRIKLARAGGKNTKYVAAVEKIARENKRALDLLGEEKSRKMFMALIAEHVVLDWLVQDAAGTLADDGNVAGLEYEGTRYSRGCPREGGKVVEFNFDNVVQTFDDVPDLMLMIKQTAEDSTLYLQERLKAVEGN